MTIAEWMLEDKISRKRLAEIAGCSLAMVSKVLAGHNQFHHTRFKKIVSASNGKVTFDAQYGQIVSDQK